MKKVIRPETAGALWRQLTSIFPGFMKELTMEQVVEAERSGITSVHLVMYHFTQFYGAHRDSLATAQLQKLGLLINEAVAIDDNLENAVSTCFLEHIHQIRSYKALAPYLSATAKRKTRA